MAFMKDILTRNIPIWEECAATPFVQEVQTGKLPLEKFKRYMIQDSIYLKNYARIYGKAIFHADTLREIQLYYSMLNFVNDTESEVRLDYLKQFCMTDNDIELIAPLPENQNYIDFMFEIASHGKNEEILMAVLPCMLSYSYIFRKLAAVPTSRQSRYWDFIKDYADEQYAESCKEWSAFAEHKCAGLSVANKKYLADIFEKASLLELAFWKMAYRNERMEENSQYLQFLIGKYMDLAQADEEREEREHEIYLEYPEYYEDEGILEEEEKWLEEFLNQLPEKKREYFEKLIKES